uniref:Uncharacterized protein n=1 Tax=Tolypothrix bouteillei VB521301 TaxID=1479485 RepID=A0A0C1NA65_9CYAN
MISQEAVISQIEYLSKDADEALVSITDGVYGCVAFCQPCERLVGELIKEPLLAFGTEGVVLSNEETLGFRRIRDTFRHEVYARVTDATLGIVSVGSIRLELDTPLPGGIVTGDSINFFCDRVDVV